MSKYHFKLNIVVLDLVWYISLQKKKYNHTIIIYLFVNENENNYVKMIIPSDIANHIAIAISVKIITIFSESFSPKCYPVKPIRMRLTLWETSHYVHSSAHLY